MTHNAVTTQEEGTIGPAMFILLAGLLSGALTQNQSGQSVPDLQTYTCSEEQGFLLQATPCLVKDLNDAPNT